MEAGPSAVKAQSPNHWTTRAFPELLPHGEQRGGNLEVPQGLGCVTSFSVCTTHTCLVAKGGACSVRVDHCEGGRERWFLAPKA